MEEKEFLRSIVSTPECDEFIEGLNEKVQKKIIYLLQVIEEQKMIESEKVKKLVDTEFYELRIQVGNQYRIILFAIDNLNFNECSKAVLLYGFHKKATKDYPKAIKKARKLLTEYQDEINIIEDAEDEKEINKHK